MGGETLDLPRRLRQTLGLSPRGRGNLSEGARTTGLSRSIPAWAGKPLTRPRRKERSARPRDFESATETTPTMRAVMDAIRASPRHALLQQLHDPYLLRPWELWARAYAQYIAWRSGSNILKGQVDQILTHGRATTQVRQWPYDEFVPIAEAIDRLLMRRRWAARQRPPTKP